MKQINLGNIQMPIEAATKTFAILAKRGAGKSYTAAVMAEEFYKAGVPFVVFDPIDVWWGLKLLKDGKTKGLPVPIFGLEHADIPLTRDMGPRIAEAIVKENISCVISTFGMPKSQQRQLITEFSEEILRINNSPRHIFIEEAHEFVPQRVMGDMGKVFNAVSNLVVMGRNRGLGVTLINQRAATINKDVLTQLDTLLAFRNTSPQDRGALKEWVEHHDAEGNFAEFMATLPSLPTGEGWIWSPEFMGIFKRLKVRERETFHPDREKLGYNFTMPKLEQVDILGFINKFKGSEAATIVMQKEEKLDWNKIRRVSQSVPILDEKKLGDIRRDSEKRIAQIESVYKGKIYQWQKFAKKLEERLEYAHEASRFPKELEMMRPNENIDISSFKQVSYEETSPTLSKFIPKVIEEESAVFSIIGLGGRKVYTFLRKNPDREFTKVQLGVVTGYSPKSGGFNNAISKLNTLGLIKRQNGLIQLNPELLEI